MRNRRAVVLAFLLVLSLVVVGCGGGDSADSTQSKDAQDNAAVGRDRDLTVALSSEPVSLDSLLRIDGSTDAFGMNVYEALLGRDPDMVIQPLLAESWEAKGKNWIFHLRKGVKFHDGSDMTAEDVVASYERVLNPKLKSLVRDSFLGGVTAIKAIDDYTVQITSETADPSLPSKTTMIVIAPAEWAAPGNEAMTSEMMGTGPFKFVKWDRGSEIDLERNADYWGESAHFGKVKIIFRPEESVRLDAVVAGEADVGQNMSPDTISQAPNSASGPFSEIRTLRLLALPGHPLADKRLREAVNLAIDRKALIDGLYEGEATAPKGQLVIQSVLGANPDLEDYPYDPERAKQLVAEAGGGDTPLTLSNPVGRFSKGRELGQAIADMLTSVGFKIEASYVEDNKYLEDVFAPTENPEAAPDLTGISYSNELMDSFFTLNQTVKCKGVTAASCDEEVSKTIEEGSRQVDLDARAASFAKAWEQMHQGAYFAALVVPNQIHALAKDLEWKPRPQAFIYFSEIIPKS